MPQHLATRYEKELILLSSIPDGLFSTFEASLNSDLGYVLYPEDEIESIVMKCFSGTEGELNFDVKRFTRFVISIYISFSEQHLPSSEFVSTVRNLICDKSNIPTNSADVLRERIERLLKIIPALASIKATSLAARVTGYTLLASKHICDLRPVFIDRAKSFEHAIVNQTLSLTVRDSAETVSDIYVALDAEQLDKLIEDLLDAKSKIECAKDHCKKNGVLVISDAD